MLRVAYILTPIEFGGSERVNLYFLANVNKRKYRIVPIILVRPWETDNHFSRKLEELGVEYCKVPVAKRPKSEGSDYLRVIRCFRMIYSILKEGSFDLVHTHGYFADIVGILCARRLRLPTISTCHGFIKNNWKFRLYNVLDRQVLKYPNIVIAVSLAIRKALVNSGIRGSKIVVIQNAVEDCYNSKLLERNREAIRQKLHINDHEVVIGYVGRLSSEKGINYLIQACAMLKQSNILFRLLIIGDGPQRTELEALSFSEGIAQQVFFTGFQAEMDMWIPSIDIFVLSSLTEGTPMALLEAMAHGVPVIATRVGGIPSIIENERNGLLVNAGNVKELYDKIKYLIEDRKMREAISIEGRKTIKEKFSIKDWSRKIETLYDLLDRKGRI